MYVRRINASDNLICRNAERFLAMIAYMGAWIIWSLFPFTPALRKTRFRKQEIALWNVAYLNCPVKPACLQSKLERITRICWQVIKRFLGVSLPVRTSFSYPPDCSSPGTRRIMQWHGCSLVLDTGHPISRHSDDRIKCNDKEIAMQWTM